VEPVVPVTSLREPTRYVTMKVSVGLEWSGITRTVRPLESRVYSEMSPTVLTKE